MSGPSCWYCGKSRTHDRDCKWWKFSGETPPEEKLTEHMTERISKNGSGEQPHNPVSNPHHYTSAAISPLEFIEAQGMGRDFCLGNALKYIGRAGKKEGVTELQDLEKAAWYLNRRIDQIKAGGV